MRSVLHAPADIAGQMGILCRGLREHSWQVIGYNWYHPYLQYGSPLVQTDAYEMLRSYSRAVEAVDIVHFHNGSTVLPEFDDLSKLKSLGKTLVMHHWGNDVRDIDVRNSKSQFKLPVGYYSTAEIQRRLRILSSFIDTAIIQDYELYDDVQSYYKRIFVLPLAIDVKNIPAQFPSPSQSVPLIVHAPTNSSFKGTSIVEAAIDTLSKEYIFNYKRIEQMPHEQAERWYLQADIIVDQVLCGTYGLLSVEAMAMGKPVVTYVRDDVRRRFPADLPIVSGHPAHLVDALRPLVKDAQLRHRLGVAGRQFVERYHDAGVVVQQLISIYDQISGRG